MDFLLERFYVFKHLAQKFGQKKRKKRPRKKILYREEVVLKLFPPGDVFLLLVVHVHGTRL